MAQTEDTRPSVSEEDRRGMYEYIKLINGGNPVTTEDVEKFFRQIYVTSSAESISRVLEDARPDAEDDVVTPEMFEKILTRNTFTQERITAANDAFKLFKDRHTAAQDEDPKVIKKEVLKSIMVDYVKLEPTSAEQYAGRFCTEAGENINIDQFLSIYSD